ncbi:MAG: translation initiation factor 2 [Candidatus Pristimantibacillus lignocellulolyticus]|uniref:Translation initiation factor 2 n=1 Tax=Candidatus Pristimantibacillus lignocellulolyticus TaxID=2994561 RepID=A0A9J6ZHB5_9BACL|nr:MAG: translation initiation factor 2 [Candidatus Pristimantibacillus lignocellulolyticus]
MNNKKNKQTEQNSDAEDRYIAKLAFLGGTLATIGDGIAAVAAGMALQQFDKEKNQSSDDQSDLIQQIEQMQKQIDLLTYKIEKMERKKR